jgi:hypothetical protein
MNHMSFLFGSAAADRAAGVTWALGMGIICGFALLFSERRAVVAWWFRVLESLGQSMIAHSRQQRRQRGWTR